MKPKSSSRRRERSTSGDSKPKRAKSSKSGAKERIRSPVESKLKRDKPPTKSRNKEKVKKEIDNSKSKRTKAPSKFSDKEKVRENFVDSKSKRTRARSKSDEKEKAIEDTKLILRKTRWQDDEKKNLPKNAPISEPVTKKEKPAPPLQIKDYLHDKEKIVDLLFQTVTGTALQELIPDYLKKRSVDELKKLCLEQIKLMADETILQIISRKVDSSNKEEKKLVEKEKILKPEQPSSTSEKELKDTGYDTKRKQGAKMDTTQKLSEEVQPQSATSEEKEKANQKNIPVVIKEEVAKDLLQPNRDSDLLELEMRARAIRSLLKVKGHSPIDEEILPKKDH